MAALNAANCEVAFDNRTRQLYATDASPYQIVPAAVAFPKNTNAAAHLIHGSSEGRFSITYCPGHLTRQEIESVNFKYADLKLMMQRYNPKQLKDGWNVLADGEKNFYISNPALGLWACRSRFSN